MVRCLHGVVVAAIVVVFAPSGFAIAADNELRTFSVTVDGKSAGTFKMATRIDNDGTETVAVVAEVKVKAGLFSYTYEHQCLEVWRGAALASVDANTNDDGKKHTVKAAAKDGRLVVTVNGKEQKQRADVLTSSGWRFPGPANKVRDVVLFDAEDGSETPAKLEPLAIAKLFLNGMALETQPFRVTGKDLDTVWWYDSARRPVRQEMKWDGHKVVLELTGITR